VSSSYFVVFCTMQFYTFLETALVTLSLLPHFIAFFSDVEIPGTPGALATTFLTFGKYILCSSFFPFNSFAWKKIEDTLWKLSLSLSLAVLNLAFTLSVLGFMIMHVSLVSGNTTTIEAST
jgi:palmitoyltransferase ZDHHC2/15/20